MSADLDHIKTLREATGMSFNDIKKALAEAGGDSKAALELLKARGATIADKKSARSTKEGLVASYVHATGKVGVLLELLCETDFVARNPLFSELAHELCLHVAAMNPETLEELIAQMYVKDQSIDIKAFVNSYIAKLGENIQIGKFTRFSI